MSYHLYAVLGREHTLRLAAEKLSSAKVVPLRFGLAMIPVTQKLAEEIQGDAARAEDPFLEFIYLSTPVAAWARDASQRGPVAYVECEWADGAGWQAAVLWKKGEVSLKPIHSEKRGPINQALELLGARAQGEDDAFEATGLGRLGRFTDR